MPSDGLGELWLPDPSYPEETVTFGGGAVGRPCGQSGRQPCERLALDQNWLVPALSSIVKTCGDRCDEEDRLAKKHCDVVRKRVAQWMKDSGCPSSVKGLKKKKKCKAVSRLSEGRRLKKIVCSGVTCSIQDVVP